jgi:hypothetical protein
MQQEAQPDQLHQLAVVVDDIELEDHFVAVLAEGPQQLAIAFVGCDDLLKLGSQGSIGSPAV